ncbi:OLC1v1022531C1 [Oldenlandia corymbosa var. corymbosa]|uniref:OLC1v1022531C1 n=1 Tax=Oldenlandia corymbosa var. corymbosa TaxID=529605 RepID=A0AAV1BYQ6_OLDCO|nr:OLC1v1022531C1 [Oldenlandia corymbosa var. corymbosa]
MELDSSFIFLTISFIFFILNLWKIFRTKKSETSQLPPGPWKLPLIGNLHQLAGRIPHRALRDLASKYGPIMHLQVGEVSTIVVSSPETAKEVMQTHDINFATRPPIMVTKIMAYDSTSISFSPYGDYWRKLRKMCTSELLSHSRVQSFRTLRVEETSNIVKCIASHEGSVINVTEKLHSCIYATSSRAILGDKCPQQETLIRTILEFVRLASGFNIGDAYPSIKFLHVVSGMKSKLMKHFKVTDSILNTIIKDHRTGISAKNNNGSDNNPQAHKDFVDVMLQFHEDENHEFSMTNDNIKSVLLDVFIAGGGTSAKTVNWAMSEMMKNPRIMEKAQEEVRQVFKDKGKSSEILLRFK